MKAYLDLLRHIMLTGEPHSDRTGVGTLAVFGYQWRHDLADGFPLLTTKRIFWKAIVTELLWFLRGETTLDFLHKHNVTIWDEWAKEGDLGPIYGQQWMRWLAPDIRAGADIAVGLREINQIKNLIDMLKRDPDSRRACVSAWNPADVPQMAMPPCHPFWNVRIVRGRLNLHFVMRSTDAFLGLPFNFASYALLAHILAAKIGVEPGVIVASFGDLHIYNNHRSQVEEQLHREPRMLPTLAMEHSVIKNDWHQMEPGDFTVIAYDPHPAIKAPVAV